MQDEIKLPSTETIPHKAVLLLRVEINTVTPLGLVTNIPTYKTSCLYSFDANTEAGCIEKTELFLSKLGEIYDQIKSS